MIPRTRWLVTALGATACTIAIGVAINAMVPVQAENAPRAGAATGLDAHELTGYWQNFDNGASNMRLRDVPKAYDLIVVAFADADPTRAGAVTFSLDPTLSNRLNHYTEADFKADIATLHSQGRQVIFSVGGEKGNVSVPDATAAANFASSAYGLMTQYGFDGVDIDLENGLSPVHLSSALRQLSQKAGKNLILTMAPQTIDFQSSVSAYMQLLKEVKDITTVVHTQYYNSGSMLGCDEKVYSQGGVDFITAQACILLKFLRPDQVSLGLPASPRGAGSGYVSPTIVNNALSCLAKRTNCGAYTPAVAAPGIRGAMTWSINWDAANNYSFANTVGPHLDTLPGDGPGPGPDPQPEPSTPGPQPEPSKPGPQPTTPGPKPSSSAGPPPGGCTASAWSASQDYNGSAEVTYGGHLWRAKWWTRNDTPGKNGQDVWADKGTCGTGPAPDPAPAPSPTGPAPNPPAPQPGKCSAPAWSSSGTYTGGTVVTHSRHAWKARWWSQNEQPGNSAAWSVWEDLGSC